MNYIGNAFSLNMLPNGETTLRIAPISAGDIPPDAVSVVGHESTARALSAILGRDVPANRAAITLARGDVLYVATLRTADGAPYRPPEGRILSESDLRLLNIEFVRVTIE